MKTALRAVALSGLVLAITSTKAAALTAASADDVCAPTQDPCVVGAVYDVTGPLDFGLRSVRITSSGRLRSEAYVSIDCGSVTVDPGSAVNPSIDARGISIRAYRACSGDGATRCLTDAACGGAGLGTCSIGTGTITVGNKLSGASANPGSGTIQAAGDITIASRINFNGTGTGSDGGNLSVESFKGSVRVTDVLSARSGSVNSYYTYGGYAGEVSVRAASDVAISALIDVWGLVGGGDVTLDADRDVVLNADIFSRGGGGNNASGGRVRVDAGRDIVITAAAGGDAAPTIDTDGGTSFYFYGYGGAGDWYSGYGGYQYLSAGGDVALGKAGVLTSNGGKAAGGGKIYVEALGHIGIDGKMYAQGIPPAQGLDSGAGGGFVQLTAGQGIRLAPGAIIKTASPVHGGTVALDADGLIELMGTVDTRGNGVAEDGYNWSHGGYFSIEGAADVSVAGSVLSGGPYESQDMTIDVCRLQLASTGRLVNVYKAPAKYPADLSITVRESMTAAAGSKILADAVAGARTRITYRDPYKAPVLDGTLSPVPLLAADPSLVGCPVCGNSEIDQGESCDDGNTVSGDGCRSDCQDEGCLAETPAFPGVPLCNDDDPCTVDRCDPAAHSCTHVLSCEEGVACTVDACVAGECAHTATDSLCDDRNDCTDDLCNATTGCVHASLTGGPCEDGDLCTVTGTCQRGNCAASDRSYTITNDIRVKLVAGADNDILKVRASLPLPQFAANPTVTGMRLVVVNAIDDVVFEANLSAADWEDRTGAGLAYSFRDTQGISGPAAGVRSARIKHYPTLNLAKLKLSMKGGEVPGAVGQENLSASFLFGSDPAIDACLTARRIPCATTAIKATCKG